MEDSIWKEQISDKKEFSVEIYQDNLYINQNKSSHEDFIHYLESMKDIQKEIEAIKKRNARVEADKTWETSRMRKIVITLLTYTVIVIFFLTMKLPSPRINAIIPTLGFLLSTLSLWFFKRLRIRQRKK